MFTCFTIKKWMICYLNFSTLCHKYCGMALHWISTVSWQETVETQWRAIPQYFRAANQYGTSVFCTDFTCKIREYEFGLQNTEIELCQFCHLKYCCQNKAYLFWVAIQSSLVAFYALNPSNTSLIITKTFNPLSSTCGSSMRSCQLPVPVVPNESTRVSTGSGWVPPELIGSCHHECFESGEEQIKGYGKVTQNTEIFSTKYGKNILEVGSRGISFDLPCNFFTFSDKPLIGLSSNLVSKLTGGLINLR